MPLNRCPLCLNEKEIVRSHLIPAAAYKNCRGGEGGKTDPILMSYEKIKITSRQVQEYLLCKDCERILNEGGEKWVLGKIASRTTFPLYEALSVHEPAFSDSATGCQVYSGFQIDEIDVQKMTHFALGVFWKASAFRWRTEIGELKLDLGKYQEELREFILGTGGFPKHAILAVCVIPPTAPLLWCFLPYENRNFGKCHAFNFIVPGIHFVLLVGRSITASDRENCIMSNPARPIVVSKEPAYFVARNTVKAYATAKVSRRTAEKRAVNRMTPNLR